MRLENYLLILRTLTVAALLHTFKNQGPVVQSIVSHKTALRCHFVKYMPNSLKIHCCFLLKKCENRKIMVDLNYFHFKFNETLTNDVVNFEQLAPGDKK